VCKLNNQIVSEAIAMICRVEQTENVESEARNFVEEIKNVGSVEIKSAERTDTVS
jgi:translation elongation factor EF-1beta